MKIGEAYHFRGHLHVIITDPSDDDAQAVAVVNISHHEDNRDQSCVIQKDEHPRVNKLSVVVYKYAFILKLGEQADFVNQSTKDAVDVSTELLSRIQEGTDSDRIPENVRRFVEAAHRKRRSKKAR